MWTLPTDENQKAEEVLASKIMRGFCFKGETEKEMTKYLFHMTLREVKNPFSIDRNFNKRSCTCLPQFFIQILTFQTYPPNKINQTLQIHLEISKSFGSFDKHQNLKKKKKKQRDSTGFNLCETPLDSLRKASSKLKKWVSV